jgi:HK97 gp10 family phage protein
MASTRKVMQIEGLTELDDALTELAEEFSPRNAKTVLRGALRDAGKIIAEAGEANAPRGATGKLAESYTVGSKLSKRQKKEHKKESPIEVFVGPTPHPKSVQTEFGNAHQAAQPHLRPAWDGNVQRVLGVIIAQTKERLEKTRKRLAQRAERRAPKMRAGE